MTLYAACLSRLGLSLARAAELHGVRVDTAKNWSAGRRTPPAGVWDDLRRYARTIDRRVDAIMEAYAQAPEPPAEVDLRVSDDQPVAMMAAAEAVLRMPVGTIVKMREQGGV
jgi:hypothetical protein